MIERNISEAEIREVSVTMEVVEDYPDDKYSPSCLLLGFTLANRALHLQVSMVDSSNAKIITIYEPDLTQWIDISKKENITIYSNEQAKSSPLARTLAITLSQSALKAKSEKLLDQSRFLLGGNPKHENHYYCYGCRP
ncbi:MAG: hypothetical protein RLZZ74_1942 [Cyanobacteriota bacterium]